MPGPATILLVEDEPHLREVMGRVLAAAGHAVVTAECGGEALALAARTANIALLLTDIRLPDMYGRRLAERLAETRSSALPPLRVLYVSGNAGEARMNSPLPRHERFLGKPFEIEDLLALTRELLRIDDGPAGTP